MSDLFHDDVPAEYIQAVCAIMVAAGHHEFQVLTKRATRLKKLLSKKEFAGAAESSNILWGVSVEDANTVFLA
jgi:protein gp37